MSSNIVERIPVHSASELHLLCLVGRNKLHAKGQGFKTGGPETGQTSNISSYWSGCDPFELWDQESGKLAGCLCLNHVNVMIPLRKLQWLRYFWSRLGTHACEQCLGAWFHTHIVVMYNHVHLRSTTFLYCTQSIICHCNTWHVVADITATQVSTAVCSHKSVKPCRCQCSGLCVDIGRYERLSRDQRICSVLQQLHRKHTSCLVWPSCT